MEIVEEFQLLDDAELVRSTVPQAAAATNCGPVLEFDQSVAAQPAVLSATRSHHNPFALRQRHLSATLYDQRMDPLSDQARSGTGRVRASIRRAVSAADVQPSLNTWLARMLPGIYPKAYRRDDEMREIA